MADFLWQEPIEPAALRRAMRQALRTAEPDWRVVAESFLAEATMVDLLAVGGAGELIAVRIAPPPNPDGGARLLAQGLADLGYFGPRLGDLQALAPELGLSPVQPARSVLFAPDFDPEVRAAAESLEIEAGVGRVRCRRYQAFRHQAQLTLALSPASTAALAPVEAASLAAALEHGTGRGTPGRRPRLTDPPSPSAFRTGLTDADLAPSRRSATRSR